MKKSLPILIILLTTFLFSKAQFKLIAEGPSFDEPRSESSRLLSMKNGSVFFLQLYNGFVDVRIYDASHKETVSTSVVPAFANGKDEFLIEAFEIKGDAVLFITKVYDKVPSLYRVIIDGTTGKLKAEEKIAELKKLTGQKRYALYYVEEGSFFISKDLNSDNYALAFSNSFQSDKNKKIDIVLYSGDHEEISHASYETSDWKEYLQFVGMTVIGSERVYLSFINDFDKLILLGLAKGSSALTADLLTTPKDNSVHSGVVGFNKYTNEVIIAANLYGKDNKTLYVYPYIFFIDPDKGKTKKIIKSDHSKAIYQKENELYGKKYMYGGDPVNIYYNKEGEFTVAYEETSSMLDFINNSFARSHIGTYDLVFVDYSRTGGAINSYIIPKNYWEYPHSTKSPAAGFGNQYKRFIYIKNGSKKYVLMNDTRNNIERLEQGGEPIQIMSSVNCDAFYFPLTGDGPIPERKYLYGKTKDEEPRSPSPFGIAVYDKENDLLITLRLSKDEKKKSVSVVWLKPE
jgi:hypothetical protein